MSQTHQIVPKLLFLIIVAFATKAYTADDDGTYCDGDGWIPFRDEKCYKLIKKWATQTDAKVMCSQEFLLLDSSLPQLVAIKSAFEQDFLTHYIFNESFVEINVWTGAKRVPNSNQFVWDDGSSMEEYTNWAEGSPSENDKGACMIMQSEVNRNKVETRKPNGKWRDVSCESPNYVICEKLPRWSIGKLQQTLLQQRKQQLATEDELTATKADLSLAKTDLAATKTDLVLTKTELTATKSDLTTTKANLAATNSDLASTKSNLAATNSDLASTKSNLAATKNDLNAAKSELTATKTELTQTKNRVTSVESNPVPLGFIYVQLSSQPEPKTLWPALKWQDVTTQYAGLFFRAEGGGAEQFGSIQAENAPRVTTVTHKGNVPHSPGKWENATLIVGDWSPGLGVISGAYGGGSGAFTLQFYTSGGEIRPRNMAFLIWKRIL